MEQSGKTAIVIKAFYEVYNELGFGFIENVYQNALFKELKHRGIPCVAHPKINVYYKGEAVGYYEADIIVYDSIILELKAVSRLMNEHEMQLRNYLKATDMELGLLLNFGPKPEVRREIFSNYYREQLKENSRTALSVSSAAEK